MCIRDRLFPIRDFILQDVNGDGKKDIICGGNMYGAEVETVRYDAGVGLLLYGDGKGGFKPAPVAESGIFSPYDTRHVMPIRIGTCLLYTSDAADERSSVDLGGPRIIKKKQHNQTHANAET